MKKLGIILMCIMVLGMISGASAANPALETKKLPIIYGSAVVNHEFTVILPENQETGLVWELRASSSSNLDLINQQYIPPKDNKLVGEHVFTLKSTKIGLETFKFELTTPGPLHKPVADQIGTYLIKPF
ncbi:MAG: protease inhibitor I42 family protein [Methanobacterium sp. ERen5]|nr:MAG: protease inhibitor I42 family protein [Methanobacterium sp. ERen5]